MSERNHANSDQQDAPMLLPLGVDGVLVRFSEELDDRANQAALAFRAAVEDAGVPGIAETATSLSSVYVRFHIDQINRADLTAAIRALITQGDLYDAGLPQGRRLWRIPTAFGGDNGPQLAEAAALAGLTPDDAIKEIADSRVRVLAIGFAPGQPYLGMLPERWDIPRQSELTPQVPASALIVAVRQLVLFTAASPTGWRHIGQTAFRCFRPESQNPFPLRAGDELSFMPISDDSLRSLPTDDGNGGAVVEDLT